MRSGVFRLASSSAIVLSGFVALASIAPAHAQPKPAGKPAAAQPAKPAGGAKAGAKPDAKGGAKPDPKAAKPDPKAAKPDPKAAKPDPKAAKPDPKAKPDKDACAAEPKPKLAEAKKKDEAKKAYKSGEAKFDKGELEGALPCYKLADAYIPGAAPKYKIAVVIDKLGKTVEAVAAYEAFLATNPPEDKYKEKIAEAKTRIDALKATPSKVKVAFTPPDAPNMKVALDGAPQAGAELTIPPGKHTLTLTADGYETATQTIDIGYAETRDVNVTLTVKAPEPPPVVTAVPTATAVAVVTQTATATAAPVQPPVEKSNIPAYVTLGLAGAGAVVGGIFGGLALSSKGDFDSKPSAAKADETDRNALIADMSFAVALTFGVTGAVLLLTDSAPAATTPAKTGAGPQKSKKSAGIPRGFIAPYATPQGGGASARFTF